jgi:hypothetical protein
MHLNGWQRIGIVASVAWALYGVYLGDNTVARREESAREEYSRCIQLADQHAHDQTSPHGPITIWNPSVSQCVEAEGNGFAAAREAGYIDAAVGGLLPIPLGWLAVYGFIALLRWIWRGFRA